jgi:type IV secretory pathway VirB9-like protein
MRKQQSIAAAARSGRFSDAWNKFTRTFNLSELAIDPGEIFDDVRDHALERKSNCDSGVPARRQRR